MGQYWKCITKDELDMVEVFKNDSYKLMEHAYEGNNIVNFVEMKIKHKPRRVWWVGDYAEKGDAPDFVLKARRGEYPRVTEIDCEKLPADAIPSIGMYLYNHTKKLWIDMDKWASDNTDSDGYTLGAIPLLTAVSNGMGGGDFYGSETFYDNWRVGSWAGDTLSMQDDKPDNYSGVWKECRYLFREES